MKLGHLDVLVDDKKSAGISWTKTCSSSKIKDRGLRQIVPGGRNWQI
jgi:hypothetical protein